MVKLAVAIRDIISNDSASPGFDSRPMHFCPYSTCRLIFLYVDMLFDREGVLSLWNTGKGLSGWELVTDRPEAC